MRTYQILWSKERNRLEFSLMEDGVRLGGNEVVVRNGALTTPLGEEAYIDLTWLKEMTSEAVCAAVRKSLEAEQNV